MARRVVHVLLPSGSKAEAEAARRAIPDARLVIGLASGHTPGQTIYGDAVVVGAGVLNLEADVTGKVERYGSMEAFAKSAAPTKHKIDVSTKRDPEPVLVEVDAPEPVGKAPDKLDDMDRLDLIQYGAKHWPAAESWATMKTDAIKEAIRAREAGAA